MTQPDGPLADELIRRRTARVLVVDRVGRLLVLAVRNRADGQVAWFMPGGGIEGDETPEQTARRELLEELNLGEAAGLRGPLWSSHYEFSWNGRRISQDEWFFVLRLQTELDAAAIPLTDPAGSSYDEIRWFALDELAALAGLIAPPDLVQRLPGILAGDDTTDAGV